MTLNYRIAGMDDLELLTQSRVTVLRAANLLPDDADLSQVRKSSWEYYLRALADGSHTAILVTDGEMLVGTGGISYFSVMPTVSNPSGHKAYIMNMYTAAAYRRQGIAFHTLDLLVRDALNRGVTAISLEATAAGRPLYEKYGFVSMHDEMELAKEKLAELTSSMIAEHI